MPPKFCTPFCHCSPEPEPFISRADPRRCLDLGHPHLLPLGRGHGQTPAQPMCPHPGLPHSLLFQTHSLRSPLFLALSRLHCVLPRRYVQVQSPSTCEGDLLQKQGLCRSSQGKAILEQGGSYLNDLTPGKGIRAPRYPGRPPREPRGWLAPTRRQTEPRTHPPSGPPEGATLWTDTLVLESGADWFLR